MEELDRVSASHALAAALEHSTAASLEHKHLLHELQGATHDSAAIAEAAAVAEPDPVRRQTLLQRLGTMNVSQRSEEHTSELQSLAYLVCRLLLEKKKKNRDQTRSYALPGSHAA